MPALSPRLLFCLVLLPSPLLADPPQKTATPAEKAFQQGQVALEKDRFEEAIGHFQVCLRLNPGLAEAQLSLAAAFLALGQDTEAAAPMQAYLEARPSHFLVRMPFAEVLTKLERFAEARVQLERYIADVQDHPHIADEQLIGCHTRLMELAIRLGDEFGERLHRGIGLYLLAIKREELGGESRRLAEELYCKAAGELTLARLEKPLEAQPCYYLRDVWRKLGQQQPAERCYREMHQRIGTSFLTPAETRMVHLADHLRACESRKR
ncbi:MAG: hypothetical protein U0840_22640 [Gemmataceae bacterium]